MDALFWALLTAPLLSALLCLLLPSPRAVINLLIPATLFQAGAVVTLLLRVSMAGRVTAASGWFFADALSVYHLGILALVFLLSSLYVRPYFDHELRARELDLQQARRFGALWLGALGAMTLVFLSNNLGILWVGIEATTLLTAFLITLHASPASLEAMWKYIIVCSVGVAFAFIGTLLVAASTSALGLDGSRSLLWTELEARAALLDPRLMKAGFLFLLVGYGTKAGLAPMHSWLPDAHSKAPAPVSAIFSGVMLNAALYCLMRYLPLVDVATARSGWAHDLLVGLGLLSVAAAAAFILFQHDTKRLLAYSSIEHVGIIALGLGLSGLGTAAALFHTLNHSLGKTAAFFSAGRLGQLYGTNDMRQMGGALRAQPLWGGALLVSILALIGVAPFALFMSEVQVAMAAVNAAAWWVLALLLAALSVVFVGALRVGIEVAWGAPVSSPAVEPPGPLQVAVVVAPLSGLLLLGLWMPGPLLTAIRAAAAVVGGAP